jgi:hypothetical protein
VQKGLHFAPGPTTAHSMVQGASSSIFSRTRIKPLATPPPPSSSVATPPPSVAAPPPCISRCSSSAGNCSTSTCSQTRPATPLISSLLLVHLDHLFSPPPFTHAKQPSPPVLQYHSSLLARAEDNLTATVKNAYGRRRLPSPSISS